MTSKLVEKYGMMVSVATVVAIFATMFFAPSLGLVAAAVMIVVNSLVMADVVRA
jgi:hypothetical protein